MAAKKTPFYELHLKHQAKIIEFAGYLMPVQYQGIIEEHKTVRSGVGMFDLSHMGEFEIRGPDAEAFLNHLTVNDVSVLKTYQVQYSAMCYEDGGMVDDLVLYKLPDKYMLVVNAANIEKDFNWVKKNLKGKVKLENKSDDIALLAIQGPLSEKVLQKMTDYKLENLKFYWSTIDKICGKEILFSRTGYTGEDGFELYLGPEYAELMWNETLKAGKESAISPVGLGARNSLRLEMKYALYGNDIDRTTNPLEAGLGWIVKLDKPDFIGKESLLEIQKNGLKRKLVAFEMQEKAFPRQGYEIVLNGNKIGYVTSGTFSAILEKGIGLGYVPAEYSQPGTQLGISIRGKMSTAVVVKPPFYKNFTHK